MEQKTNYLDGFRISPTGPCSILRVIAIERSPDSPSEVTAIGRVDVMLDDVCCHFGEATHVTFGRRTGGGSSEAPACLLADLVRAIWLPFAPDVIISHDLATQRLAFPRAITGPLPWIGTLRVARHAWGADLPPSPGEILSAKGLDDLGVEGRHDLAFPPAMREALQVASLVDGLVANMDVRRWAADHPSAAHALRPIIGEMAADFSLQGMLDMSVAEPAPPSDWPGPWDHEDVWRMVPLDDLVPYAGSADDGSCGMALAEVRRRTAGMPEPEGLPRAPVLLRRVRFDIPETGRCDGW